MTNIFIKNGIVIDADSIKLVVLKPYVDSIYLLIMANGTTYELSIEEEAELRQTVKNSRKPVSRISSPTTPVPCGEIVAEMTMGYVAPWIQAGMMEHFSIKRGTGPYTDQERAMLIDSLTRQANGSEIG